MVKQAEMMRGRGYVTASEAATRFGRHITSIYRLAENGSVEGMRVGRSWYIKLDSLIAYANKENPDAAKMLGLTSQPAKE